MSCLANLNLLPLEKLNELQSRAKKKKNYHEAFWLFLGQNQTIASHQWETWSGWALGHVIDVLADSYSIDLKTPTPRFFSISNTLSKERLYQFYFLDSEHKQKYLVPLKEFKFIESDLKEAINKQGCTWDSLQPFFDGINVLHDCLAQVNDSTILIIHFSF